MQLNGWVYDLECDNLYLLSKQCWYGKFKSIDGKREMSIFPFRDGIQATYNKIREWIYSFEDGAMVVGFNQLGYDNWIMWKMFDIVPRVGKQGKDWLEGKHVQFIDGYILSQYLSPDNPQHSLGYLSNGIENEDEGKLNYRQSLIEVGAMKADDPKGFEFSFFHPLIVPYCDRDVDATIAVVKRLWAKAQEMYGVDNWLHPSFRQMQKDYWLYCAQAYTGALFNQEKAQALIDLVEVEMDKIKKEVDPKLPPRPLKTAEKAFYKQPSKPYSKSGEMSATMLKWLAKHDAKLIDGMIHAYDFIVPVESNAVLPVKLPLEIEDNAELKQFFLDNGWIPSDDFWNFKKGPDGKPIRDENRKFIKTTPKIQDKGKICPNLLKLNGEIPAKVVKFLSYRNRLGVVKGWLGNWRIKFDGRISAEISGYAPTSRVRHKVLVNCPKASPEILLGSEMRDLFYVSKGYWYVGVDAAALENRTLASYTFKYDGGKFARMQTEGDPHSFNVFAFYPHLKNKFDIDNQENKENPEFKPWRGKAKTGAYLLAFGGGAMKLASSLGLSKKEGQIAYDNYWKMNEGLGKLKNAVEQYYTTTGKGKYIPAIDGRLVSVRAKNVLLSCLGQGCGAIAMSYAACFMDNWLGELYLDELGRPYYLYKGKVTKRISMQHDEYSWETEDGINDDIRDMGARAIVAAGEALKLSLPLQGEGKMSFEGSWRDVH